MPTTPTTSTAPAMSHQSKLKLAIKLTIAIIALLTALGLHRDQKLLYEFKDAGINSKKNLRPTASITTKDTTSNYTQQTEEQMNKPTTVIQDLVSENHQQIIGDVSYLLDYAVLGFPKTGTTALMRYLNTENSRTLPRERCELDWAVFEVVKSLFEDLPQDNHVKRGLKCPQCVSNHCFKNLSKYFYKTKLIVGVRHPVLWFQSFYNYRVHYEYAEMPAPHVLLTKE